MRTVVQGLTDTSGALLRTLVARQPGIACFAWCQAAITSAEFSTPQARRHHNYWHLPATDGRGMQIPGERIQFASYASLLRATEHYLLVLTASCPQAPTAPDIASFAAALADWPGLALEPALLVARFECEWPAWPGGH